MRNNNFHKLKLILTQNSNLQALMRGVMAAAEREIGVSQFNWVSKENEGELGFHFPFLL